MEAVNSTLSAIPFSFQPRSLAWDGDELVDWVGGGTRWSVTDGSQHESGINYAFCGDRAVVSPSGRYSVIYAERATKGLVLDRGKILREINRSYYCADAYAYPVALGQLPDGREVIAHCPDDYNRIHIDTLAEGKRLTRRRNKSEDIFHSRLSFSPDGRHLLSAGWVWHPFEIACVLDVTLALEVPRVLDRADDGPGIMLADASNNPEVSAAWWIDNDRIVVTTSTEYDDEDTDLPAERSGIWSVRERRWLSRSTWNPQGSLQRCAGGVLYVENGFPHWWGPDTGEPLSWPDVEVAEAPLFGDGGWLKHDCPLLAAHPTEKRFAAATANVIVVVEWS
ncbi:hypothetical protein [Sphingomonas sp. RT2P30]|uniref:hypothetical protein n=1 Tax=Parasphingomonas halimpatiens TaxID=3096162 RepID=UPI002FCC6235